MRYVNFCKDHEFLKHQYLEPGTGITYELINQKVEETNDKPEPTFIQLSGYEPKIAKDYNLKVCLVEEVIRERRMKFFKEPRLGSYFALDISYRSSFSKESLDTSVEYYKDYKLKLAEKAEADRIKEEQLEEAQRIKEENPNLENLSEQDKEKLQMLSERNKEDVVEEKIELKEFIKKEKRYILCLDTMGQDRTYDIDEQKYILKVAQTLVKSWENLEERILLENRDKMMEMIIKDKEYKKDVKFL